jgi:hypothetical protein
MPSPLCDRENSDTSSFCIYCGAVLHNVQDETEVPEIGPEAPEQQRVISGLTRDVRQIQREMRQVLSILSLQHDTAVTRQPMSPGPTVEMRTASEAPVLEPSLWHRVDWEPIVGGNWLVRIGIVAIVNRGTTVPENEMVGVQFGFSVDDATGFVMSEENSEYRWITAEEGQALFPHPHFMGHGTADSAGREFPGSHAA